MYDNLALNGLSKWSGFLGGFLIVTGVLQVISIVGILSGILCIIMGVKLRGAKKAAHALTIVGEADSPGEINKMIDNLRSYFQINGILIIISLILSVLTVIGLIISVFVLGNALDFDFNFFG